MTTHVVHVAVIEWDSSETPSVIVGATYVEVAREAARQVRQADYIGDDREFFHDVDRPENQVDVMHLDEDALDEWHSRLREATTVPWVTFEVERVTFPTAS
jgi:hypothetical protein